MYAAMPEIEKLEAGVKRALIALFYLRRIGVKRAQHIIIGALSAAHRAWR